MSKPPSKSSSRPPSKPSSKTPSKEPTKPQALTPEEEEQLRLDEERLRQEEVLGRLANAGCICAGIAGADGLAHGQTLALEAETCRRSVRRSKGQGTPGTWMTGPVLTQPRWHCCAAAVGDGQLLVVGGFDEFGLPLDTTELVDFATGSVEPGPKLSTARAGAAAVSLPLPLPEDETDLRMPWILVAGGYGPDAGPSTEVLDLEAMKSYPGPALMTRRACCVAVMYGEDEVMIAGGFDEFASVSSTEFINLFKLKHAAVAERNFQDSGPMGPEEDEEVPLHASDLGRTFTVPGPEMLERRAACAAVELPKPEQDKRGRSRVWIIGGTNERGQRLETSEWMEVILPEHLEDHAGAPRRLSRRLSRAEAQAAAAAAEDAADADAAEQPEEPPEAEAENTAESAAEGSSATGGEAEPLEAQDADPEAKAPEAEAPEEAEAAEADEADEAEDEGEAEETPPAVVRPDPVSQPSHTNPRHFEPGPSMLLARSGLAAVRLNEVVVLIAGGVGADGGHLDATEFFDFEDRKEVMQQGPCLSWGCEGPVGFGYCAAGRAVVES